MNDLEQKLQYVFDEWKQQKTRETTFALKNDKYKILKKICDDLNCVYVQKDEYDKLMEDAKKNREQMDKEVKTRYEEKAKDLQKEVEYIIEKKVLENKIKVVRLEERIRCLSTPPVVEPQDDNTDE